ncbi:glycosyltransferase family 39 protein [Oligoflexia bacterium]|nr:glycosyltransferase family 39 protein [Oligoflexia bacterium]
MYHSENKQTGAVQTHYGLLLAILVCAVCLRVFRLDFQSFWFDECASLYFATQATWQDFLFQIRTDFHPPGYYGLLRLWLALLPESEASVRLLSAFLGSLAVVVIYLIARTLFSLPVALLAALFSSTSLLFIWASQEARAYALIMLLALCSTHMFILLWHKPQWRYALGYLLANVLLLFSHYASTLLLAAHLAFVLVAVFGSRRHVAAGLVKRRITLYLCSQLATLFCFLPWLSSFLVQLDSASQRLWIPEASWLDGAKLFLIFLSWRPRWPNLYPFLTVLLVCVVCASLFLFLSKKRPLDDKSERARFTQAQLFVLLWLFLPPLLAWSISFFSMNIFFYKPLIFSAPALFILLAQLVMRLPRNLYRVVFVALIISFSAAHYRWYYFRHHKQNWRAAAAFVASKARPSDQFRFEAAGVELAFDYYFRNSYQKLRHNTDATSERVWFIRSLSSQSMRKVRQEFETVGYHAQARENFTGIRVLLFQKGAVVAR